MKRKIQIKLQQKILPWIWGPYQKRKKKRRKIEIVKEKQKLLRKGKEIEKLKEIKENKNKEYIEVIIKVLKEQEPLLSQIEEQRRRKELVGQEE